MTPPIDQTSPGGVVLVMAAGQSRRFGSDKRLARWPSDSTSRHTSLLAATLARVMSLDMPWRLVLREDDDLATLLGGPFAALHADNVWRAPNAAAGLGASLGDAFRQLSEETSLAHVASAVVWLADMPQVTATTVQTLLAKTSDDGIVRPVIEKGENRHAGHPVVFGRRFWSELAAIKEGEGARDVIARHQQSLQEVMLDDEGIHRDVDTPAMLAAIWPLERKS